MPKKTKSAEDAGGGGAGDDGANNMNDYDNLSDGEQRFAWLLTPIRDLAKNWDVDITAVLGKYIEELEQVMLSNSERSGRATNFAEAAMLIQGSTCVYSKKVELLYQLCLEVVHSLASKKEHKKTDDNAATERGETAAVENENESGDPEQFESLDDIEAGRNIDLNEDENHENDILSVAARVGLIRAPMPLSLIPLEDFEKSDMALTNEKGETIGKRDDFKINTLSIDITTGALLLDPSNSALVKDISGNAPPAGNEWSWEKHFPSTQRLSDGVRSVPVPDELTPRPEGASFYHNETGNDDGLADDTVIDFDPLNDHTVVAFDPIHDAAVTAAVPPPPPPARTPLVTPALTAVCLSGKATRRTSRKSDFKETIDSNPWHELDVEASDEEQFAAVNRLSNKPFKRRMGCLEPNIDGAVADLSQEENRFKVLLPSSDEFDYFEHRSACRQSKMPKRLLEIPKNTPLTDIYSSATKRRKIMLQHCKEIEATPGFPVPNGDPTVASNNYVRRESSVAREEMEISRNLHAIFSVNYSTDDEDGDPFADHDNADMANVEADLRLSPEHDADVFDTVEHSTTAEAFAASYGETVRRWLEAALTDAKRNTVVSEMNRRVQAWENRIGPVLKEEEGRRKFDVHEYGDDLLKFFDHCNSKTFSFHQFAKGKSRWELARYFLSSLMLANGGNIEPRLKGEEGTAESINTYQLKLLNRERRNVFSNPESDFLGT